MIDDIRDDFSIYIGDAKFETISKANYADIIERRLGSLKTPGGDVPDLGTSNVPTKSTGRFVSGYASTPDIDTDGESVVQDGLDLTYYNEQGWINYMHNNAPSHVIGFPTDSRIDTEGFYTRAMLFTTDMANHVWELATQLDNLGNPRKLGFSIEGKVTKRSEINPKKIVQARITNVAITHIPVNPKALLTIDKFAKSMVPSSYDSVMKTLAKDVGAGALSAIDGGGMDMSGYENGVPVDGTDGGLPLLTQMDPRFREVLNGIIRLFANMGGQQTIVNQGEGKTYDQGIGVNLKEGEGPLRKMNLQLAKSASELFTIKKNMYNVIKSVKPKAPDAVVNQVIDLIFKSGSLEKFGNIIKNI